ncbi:MAG: phage holin family protein [Sphingomonadales bacterium]|nr:phage holin family protein [Sphingomonadales bacterium]MBK6721528.1 phage holin family protein [Sphingomonadales bacterium]MBK9588953.1 phage holin family protein [Sphingomonadales bacterium]
MSDAQATDREASPEDQGLKALAVQLADDATAFVVAETSYLKAEFGERAEYAQPAIYAVGFGWALMLGTMLTLPFALILMLAPIIGIVWAVVLVSGGSLLVGRLLALFGMRRIKASLKPKDER